MAGRRPPRGAGEGLLRPTPRSKGVLALDDMIAALVELDANGLCLQWRNHLGGTPPAHLPRWLLMKILAHRIQAAAFGGSTKRRCASFANRRVRGSDHRTCILSKRGLRQRGKGSSCPRMEWQARACDDPRPGRRLERRDLRQPVASRQGDDRHKLERHRFFGLRTARSDRSRMVPRRSGDCDAASSGAASIPIEDGGAALARHPSRQAASP